MKAVSLFSGAGGLDLGRFLDLIAAEGMHAIVRPGPYICAEWHNGGLPAWLFEDASVDAVIIATPDHWHALPMIAAVESGMDVWVQKPISVDIAEGKAGAIDPGLEPILVRLGLVPSKLFDLLENFDRWMHGAVGCAKQMAAEAARTGRHWLHGSTHCAQAFSDAV